MLSILQICNRFPFPPKDGGSIGLYNITKSFYQLKCKTDLLAINTKKHHVTISELPDSYTKMLNNIYWVDADTSIKPFDAFLNLFTSESYNLKRFDIDIFRDKLIDILKNNYYDVIHVDGLYVSMYLDTIRSHSDAVVTLRAHNIEYIIWERLTEKSTSFLKKTYLNLLTKRLRKFELEIINNFDAIIPVTSVDANILKENGCHIPIFVSPAGVDLDIFKPTNNISKLDSLFFIGALDWMPNIEAIDWFLQEVWPRIYAKFPFLKFYIAGRNMPERIKNINTKNVYAIGEVESALDFMHSKSIMIVPIISGSGIRIKIIEGLSAGKVIITTSIGAEGIEYTNKKNILIADSPEQFLEAISYTIENDYVCDDISKNARILVESKYSNNSLIHDLLEFYQTLVLKKQAKVSI